MRVMRRVATTATHSQLSPVMLDSAPESIVLMEFPSRYLSWIPITVSDVPCPNCHAACQAGRG